MKKGKAPSQRTACVSRKVKVAPKNKFEGFIIVYHPVFIFIFLFLVDPLPSVEVTSKSRRCIKIKMVSIIAFPNDLSPHCKNVQQYLDNYFFHECFFDITRRYRLVCAQTSSLNLSTFFCLFFSFFSKLGSFILIMHISEMCVPTISINHEIFENP